MAPPFDESVFVNCPFDIHYSRIFDAIVFAVHDCGFIARCALEVDEGAEDRFAKLLRMIQECKFGIHDISRTQIHPQFKLPRFNMPLELGLFLGCQRYGSSEQRQKSCLILDKEKYRYRRFISDIAGHDVHAHDDKPEQALREVRNWLRTSSNRGGIPGPATMWKRFLQFQDDLPAISEDLNLDVPELIFVDYTYIVAYWLKYNTP